MKSIAVLLLFVLSGVVFALSLPPFLGGAYTVLPALACLLLGVKYVKSGVFCFAGAMLAGIVTGLIHLRGGYGSSHFLSAFVPFLFIALEFGMVALAALLVTRLFPSNGKMYVLGVACSGAISEWLLTFTPLPASVAVTLSQAPILLQPAALGGIYLLAFLLWGTSAYLSHLIWQLAKNRHLPNRHLPNRHLPKGWHPLVLVDVLLVLILATNLWGKIGRDAPSYTVAALQDFNGQEAQDVTGNTYSENLPEWDTMARQAQKSVPAPALIVGPEECLGTFFRPNDPTIPANQLARELHTQMVLGFVEPNTVASNPNGRPFNSAACIGPEGTTETIHHKIKPFLGEMLSIQKGETATVDTKTGIGMLICFDTCWPQIVREIAQKGGRVLAVPTYDPPTPNGVLTHLHAALMPIRAVENNLPIVRADANGKSQVIDGNGVILAESPLWASSIALGTVTPRTNSTRFTLYTLWGAWVVWASLGVWTGLLVVRLTKLLPKFLTKKRE